MEIKSIMQTRSGPLDYIYRDVEKDEDIVEEIKAVHAYCFHNGKLVICHAPSKGENYWTLPGGGVEEGESIEEATIREIKEESNMKVLHRQILGYITYTNIYREGLVETQTRSVCIVEPYGEFTGDPDDGEITEIKLIDPAELPDYLDWGEIGDHMLKKAMEIARAYTK